MSKKPSKTISDAQKQTKPSEDPIEKLLDISSIVEILSTSRQLLNEQKKLLNETCKLELLIDRYKKYKEQWENAESWGTPFERLVCGGISNADMDFLESYSEDYQRKFIFRCYYVPIRCKEIILAFQKYYPSQIKSKIGLNAYLADSCFRIFRREAGFLEVAIPSKD